MAEDLIKDSFCTEVNKKIITRHIIVLKAMLGLVSIYSILQSIWWYKILSNAVYDKNSVLDFLEYRLTPITIAIVALADMVAWWFYLQGVALLKNSLVKYDAEIFNAGYNKIYSAGLITLVSYVISCLELGLYLIIF